ncbi:hypothetical protein CspeluHIS016_0303470 [Cutaneotrichosporon spelunceum]|uniref:GLTSCR protein conserved domain-containing protein n=1 Tax=Cutaneotrichosporon spelunceum TaxID=1672016 RepID=A0AAD3TTD0_9TREE|nr:hypothetical protein CspeluHIS016_0303470 [Cutaneotrichosporon spelunceum]
MDGSASAGISPSPFPSTPLAGPVSAPSTPAASAPPTPSVPPSPLKDIKPKTEPGEDDPGDLDVLDAGPSLRRKRKLAAARYSPAEVAEVEARAAAIDFAVALDQQDTLYADQTRFTGFSDVVDRLLPWHIWQVPEDELVLPSEQRDKEDLGAASEQVANLVDIRRRFAKVRRREGNHPSDLPSLIYMLRESTSDVRDELAAVQATLKIAKSKHELRLAEERRVREAAAAKERARLEDIERQRRNQFLAQAQAQARQQAAQAAVLPSAPAPAPATAPAAPAALPVQTPAPSGAPLIAPVAGGPSTPVVASAAPATTSTPTVSTGTPTAPVRGRPRGRPRGSGRGGMRQPSATHADAAATATPKKTTSPVQITVAMSLIPAFVAAALLILPNPQNLKAPATIIRTSDDKKNVTLSIDLGSCSQPQLQTLARLLNVQAKLPAANAAGSGTPNGTGTTVPPAAAAATTAPASVSASAGTGVAGSSTSASPAAAPPQ